MESVKNKALTVKYKAKDEINKLNLRINIL